MESNRTKCIKRVGGIIICQYCNGGMIKYGVSSSGEQRFQCKTCKRTQVESYKNKAYLENTNEKIIDYLKEGCGIRSISRLLEISVRTVSTRILKISRSINRPHILTGKEYEMDEIKTYVGRKTKQIWVAYAIQKDTKRVVDFLVGRRTKKTLSKLVETLHLSKAKRIFTDKLNIYQSLITGRIHSTKNRGTNYIERNHLTIRTHLKRLNRRTICFSRSIIMLSACLRIYFWS